jgi:hypothetical protein
MTGLRVLVVRSFPAFVAGLRNDYIRPAAGATMPRCEATLAA